MSAANLVNESEMLTGAELIAQKLRDNDVRHAFGIISIHNMPIIDAINRLGFTQMIDSRHEGAATHSADGYARATGKLGVCIASTGPGTTNTVTGLYEAAYANSRVLVITGQAETSFYGKGAGYVHEAENQLPMLRSVARRVESPKSAGQIGVLFDAVVTDMSSGRWQPGALEIPIDLQYAPAAPKGQQASALAPLDPSLQRDQLQRAAEKLREASRRLIVLGGGAMRAGPQIVALAEALGAPILTTVNGRGAVSEDHELCIGNLFQVPDMLRAVKDADVTLAIGTRFQVGVDGRNKTLVPPGELVHIDIDNNVLNLVHEAAVAVQGDAAAAVLALHGMLADANPNDAQFNAGALQGGDDVKGKMRERLGPDFRGICTAISNAMDPDTVLVRDSTVAAYFMANQLIPIRAPHCTISPTSGAIGPGLPFAVGAAAGTGKRTLVIHGDGGFMFHATELATAAQHNLPMTVCIFNDGGYGILRFLQNSRFEGRINETDLGFMDFTMMAKSMGCNGERVDSVEGLETALATAAASDGPYVVDIDVRKMTLIGGMRLPE